MDNELSSIEAIETPSLDDKNNEMETNNYEGQEAGKETFKVEIDKKEEDLNENDYIRANEEELIDEPVLNEFEEDPLELKTDVKIEEKDEKLIGSGCYVLGEGITDRIVCDICNEYSCITKSSFRYKIRSFCDTCYHNHLRKSKFEWMDVMYEWYKSCMICMNVVYNSLDMVKHDCTCKNVYNCNNCALIVVKKEDIDRHMELCISHSSYIAVRKSVGLRFSLVPSSAESHERTRTGQKPYHCNICKKSFSESSKLKVHLHTHPGEKSFPCKICKKSFSLSSNLKRHVRTHTGEKPYNCNICKNSFSVSSSLKNHLRTHTGEKPYNCNICKNSFSVSSSLKNHLRTHTGETPFPCKICKKSFSRSSSLKCHVHTHTGEKPFPCKICKKSFSLSSSLKRHVRTHTGQKPYHCKICKKSFSHSSNLKRHVRTH